MKNFTKIFLNIVDQELKPNRLEWIKIEYGLQIVKSEGIKLLILAFFYILTGKLKIFLFCVSILIPVRIFSGGLHMKSHLTCFLFSFCFFALPIFLLPKISLSAQGYRWILIVSIILIIICAPVVSPQKAVSSGRKIKYKLISALAVTIIGSFIYRFYLLNYQHSGIWTIALQSIQLIFALLLKKINKKEMIS